MNLEYDNDEKTQIILMNISKMVQTRKLVKDSNNFYNAIKKIGDNLN